MSKRIKSLRKNNSPLATDDRILEVDRDVDMYAAIAAFSDSEGGTELRKAMRADAITAINTLMADYKQMTYEQLVSLIAQMERGVSILLALGNARTNKEDAEKILDELIAG